MHTRARDKRFTALLTLVILSLVNITALAQSTATVQGTVTDASGAVIANAKITAKNQATGLERTTSSDAAGNYQIASLPVGAYKLEIKADGFQPEAVNGLTLQVSQTVVQNIQLRVGGVAQEVTVTAEAPVVESSTITVGQVIDRRTVQDIPLNGRHFVDLGLLSAGTVTPPQSGFLTAPLRGQGSFAINTAGNREDTVNFMINGVNLNDMVQNQITFQPSINTVQEFKVNNSTFSAEYGRNSGAIVNIATRSGTNEWHGEAFEFLRNDVFDAKNFFTVGKKAPFKRNQFGANFGGPIKKDKAFFFATYEGTRQRQGIPFLGGVLSDTDRALVTDPTVQKLLKFIPEPNTTIVTSQGVIPAFGGSGTAPVNIDQWTGDVSYYIGGNDRLHGYYAFQKDLRNEPNLQGNSVPGFGDTRQSHRQIFTLNETHTFGPHLVNEARFGFNRIHITFSPIVAANPADFGINEGVNTPIALPQISVASTLNIGGPAGFPQGRGDTVFVLSDTASYLHGRHSLNIGGEFRNFYNNNFAQTAGTFNFAAPSVPVIRAGQLDPFVLFEQGKANSFANTVGSADSSLLTRSLGLFIQDGFKAKPYLTFELGLRWDVNTPPSERFNRLVNFDPATDSLIRVGSGLDQVYATNKRHFQPRLGFAWDMTRDGKTVLRGAYAILYDQPVTNSVTPTSGNPPLATPLSVTSSTSAITFSNALTLSKAGLAPAAINGAFLEPYVQNWNLNLQREITPTLSLMAGYFGSKGTHLRIARNINELLNGKRAFPTLSASSPILPGAAMTNITEVDSASNSSYNAMWISVNKRVSRGMQFSASYTLSKSIDYNSLSSQGVVVQDSLNIRGDRGLSDFDARHRFVINWIYDLPFKGNRFKEGWQLSGISQIQSGNPIRITSNGINFTGNATIRPDIIGPVAIAGDPFQWFSNAKTCDPRVAGSCTGAAFALPVSASGVFHFGNLGRDVFIGPGFNNTDFSISKSTRIKESYRLQFRADFFDIFNQANFGQPNGVAGSSPFGSITSTRFPPGDSGSSRQLQFSVKFLF